MESHAVKYVDSLMSAVRSKENVHFTNFPFNCDLSGVVFILSYIAGEQLRAHFLSRITMRLMICTSKLLTKQILMNQLEEKGFDRMDSNHLFLRD